MIKKILVLFMAALMMFSFVGCSKATGPAIYNEVVLTINGEDVTYEYYRYYYLSALSSYAEDNQEQIISDVLDKLLYDRAVDLILTDNKIELTAEEKAELESMLAMYETTYGSTFYTQLKEQNMTVDVFNRTMTDMIKYNKLYEYYAEEKNGKLDFTAAGVQAVLDNYNSGLHFVINKGGSITDKEAKQLTEKVYSMLAISDGFTTVGELLSLRESIKQTKEAIDDINEQIENGSNDNTLVTSLSTLTKKLGELNDALAKKDYTDGVKEDLEVYITKVDEYLEYAKAEIISSVNSDDAELVAMIEGKELEKISEYLSDNGKKAISDKLSAVLTNIKNNTSSYSWLSSEYKSAIDAFVSEPNAENAKVLNDLYIADRDLKTDTLITNVNTVIEAYIKVAGESCYYEYRDAFYAADGLLEIDGTFYASVAEVAAILDAQNKATELLASLKDGSLKANDISYEDLAVLGAVVYDFEELIAAYSDGYNSEAETQMFYYKVDDLIDELSPVVSKLDAGEYSSVVESSNGYHIFMVLESDAEHFKENYFVYAALEDIIKAKADTIEYTTTELYDSMNAEKIKNLEKELADQVAEIEAEESGANASDSTVLWTVIIIIATIAVVVVLAVAIVYSTKAPSQKEEKKKETYKIKSKTDAKNKKDKK